MMSLTTSHGQRSIECGMLYALCQYNRFKPLPFFQFNFPRNTIDTIGKSIKFCIQYVPPNTM